VVRGRSGLPRIIVIFLQLLQEMFGFGTYCDVSENSGAVICCGSGTAAGPQTAVCLFPCILGRVRLLSVACGDTVMSGNLLLKMCCIQMK
jgi:hypothetical protein